MIGLEMDKNMTWNTIPKQHSKQHDGSSCGVYVLTVYSCTSLNKYLIFHHIKKKNECEWFDRIQPCANEINTSVNLFLVENMSGK